MGFGLGLGGFVKEDNQSSEEEEEEGEGEGGGEGVLRESKYWKRVLSNIRVLPVPVGLSNKENLRFGSWRVLYKEDIKRY